ncbi:hypothetical protein Ddye_030390 [Dipteronia dyeriana]|uniref:Reverse transcriptase domain-containing protein n=1 Tax=Dipteronia dyeriana TaxID=168575 RepID=A0AAD9WMP1_9ROSI|nr:hypothetical protein Ddye_030390 [Dipteronia dyeriana]
MNQVIDRVQPRLSPCKAAILDHPFSTEEVRITTFLISPNKTPGPDGMSRMFYQKNWDIVGHKVTAACLHCLNDGISMEDINSTLIVLIPKVRNPKQIKEFRPISLCNVIYKIVAKALVSRLRMVIDDVISKSQSAFIPGRLIIDNALIGFECLHAIRNRKWKMGSFAIKLDMMKAYDRVEWTFLDTMMRKLGFYGQWVAKMMNCVSTVSFSFVINGEVCGLIKPS